MKKKLLFAFALALLVPWVAGAQTPTPPATLPYSTGFETDDDCSWELLNGTLTNKWVLGTAVHNVGSRSLYVSNNNGTGNEYTVSSTACCFAVRTFTFSTASQYAIGFDWKSGGESTYDYLRCFLVPNDVTLTAGTSLPSGVTSTGTPSGWIDLGGKMNLSGGSWMHTDATFDIDVPGDYKIVFLWRNDVSGGTQPAVAVDNVSVHELLCPAPQLTLANLSPTGVVVSWPASSSSSEWLYSINGSSWQSLYYNELTIDTLTPSSNYIVSVRAYCGGTDTSFVSSVTFSTPCEPMPSDSLPYFEGFETTDANTSYSTAGVIPDCWNAYSNGTVAGYVPHVVSGTGSYIYRRSGNNSLVLYPGSSSGSNGDTKFVLLPPVSEPLSNLYLSFWMCTESATYGELTVGYLMGADLSSFVPLQSIHASANTVHSGNGLQPNNGMNVEVNLSEVPVNATRLAIKWYYNGAYGCCIDDVLLSYPPACLRPEDLNLVSAVGTEATLEWESEAGEFIFEYGLSGFQPGQGDTILLSSNSIDLTGLQMGKVYDYYVTAICGSDTSTTAFASFIAGCAALTSDNLPFFEDFESYGTGSASPISACWSKGAFGTSTAYPYPYASAASNGIRGLYFYGYKSGTTMYSSWAALPPIDESLSMSDLMVEFMIKRPTTATYNTVLYVGVADSVVFPSVDSILSRVTWMDTVNLNSEPVSSTHRLEVSFAAYEGTGRYVVFYAPSPTATYNYVYVDDVNLMLIPSCYKPESARAVANSYDEVTLDWVPDERTPNPSSWLIEYGPVGFTEDEALTVSASDTTETLYGLNPDTWYEFRISADCGGTVSDPRIITFHTPCAPITEFPYVEDFESYTSGSANPISACWFKGTNSTTAYPYPNTTNAINGNISLYFYGYYPSTATSTRIYSYAALPLFDTPVNELSMSFKMRRYSTTSDYYTSKVIVGVMTDPYDISTFDTVQVVDLRTEAGSSIHEILVDFSDYAGEGQYMTIYCPVPELIGSSTYAYNYAYIDDVTVSPTPSCSRPQSIAFEGINDQSATLVINDSLYANNYVATLTNLDSVNAEPIEVTITDTAYTFTGLSSQTNYMVSLSTDCGDGTSTVPLTRSFRTACTPVATANLPYIEDFESYGTGASSPISPCWTKGTNSTTAYPYPYSTSPIHGSRSLFFNSTTSNIYSYAALPLFDEPLENLMLEFDMKRYSTTTAAYHSQLLVGVMSNPNDVTSFDTIAVCDLTSEAASTVRRYRIPFAGYEGSGHIAFMAPALGTSQYNPVYLDSVVVRLLPNCVWPTDLTVDNVTFNSIDISFNGAEGGTFRAVISDADGVVVDSADIVTTNYTFTGLLPQTTYNIRLATVCGNDVSLWTSISATTGCAPIDTLPWMENFDSHAATSSATDIDCWEHLGGGYVNYYTTSGAHLYSGTSLRFYPNSSTTGNVLVLPTFNEPVSQLEISLMSKPEGTSSGSFSVGYVTNPTDANSFVEVQEYPISHFQLTSGATTVSYVQLTNTFAGAPDGARIALRHNVGNTAWYWFIDNIDVHEAPACLPASALAVTDYADTTISISFNGIEGSTFGVSIRNASGTYFDTATITSFNHTFNGLTANTEYTISVTTICAVGSAEASTISARTACRYTLPYTEDFESYTSGSTYPIDPCWVKGTNYSTAYPYPYSTNAITGNRSLYFYANRPSSGSSYYSYAALPMFEDSVKNLSLSMNIRRYSTTTDYYTTRLVIGVMTDPTDITTFEPMDTIDLKNEDALSIHGYEFFFNNYTGNGKYIALYDEVPPLYGSATYSYSYVYVDDILVDRIPSCMRPTNLVADNIGETTATLHWTSSAANFDIEYGPHGYAVGNGTMVTSSVDSVVLTGLSQGTTYDVYVRARCSATDTSAWSFVYTFVTECGINILPYTEDFESYGSGATFGIDPCWVKGTNNTTAYPYPYATNAITGSRSLYFYAYHPSSGTSYYSYAALPLMQDSVKNLMLRMNVRRYSTVSNTNTTRLVIGVMTNPADIATFTPMDTLDLFDAAASSVHGYEFYFNNYTGNGEYIAIYNEVPPLYGTGTSCYSYAYVDDILVDYIPDCLRPFDVTFSNIGQSSATVHWTGNASSYEIEYGLQGFAPGTGTTVSSTTDSVVLTGLTNSVNYDVYVRGICSLADESEWSYVRSFATVCGLNPLPIAMNFDDEVAGTTAPLPNCWVKWNDNMAASSGYYPYVYNSASSAHSGNNSAYFYFSTSTSTYPSDEMLVTPEIDTVDFPLNTVEAVFWAKRSTYAMDLIVGIVADADNPNTTFTAVDTIALTNAYTEYTVSFADYTGYGNRVAFRGVHTGSSAQYIYIDDITIEQISSCERAYDLTAYNGAANSVTLEWSDTIGSSQWIVSYANGNADTWTEVLATSNPFVLTGLTPNTLYRYRVAPVCAGGDIADWSREIYSFSTSQVPATIPYSYDFEDAAEWANWQTSSNNSVNWYRGNSAIGDSSYAMYLSTDAGATQSWNLSAITNAAVYRDFDFGTTPTSVELSFRALVGGSTDGNYDGISIMVVDPAVVVTSSSTGLTSPWGHVSSVDVRMDTVWANESVLLDGLVGVKRLVFFHFNQSTASTHPYINIAPAIDDIAVSLQACPRPYDLTASNISSSSALLSWGGDSEGIYLVAHRVYGAPSSTNVYDTVIGNTSFLLAGLNSNEEYIYWVLRVCSLTDSLASDWSNGFRFTTECGIYTLPFTETFDSVPAVEYNAAGGQLPDCWRSYTNGNSDIYIPHVVGSGSYWYSLENSHSLTMTSGSGAAYGDTKIVALPPFNAPVNGCSLSFYYRHENASYGQLTVGYVTGPDLAATYHPVITMPAIAEMTFSDTLTLTGIPANATRIALRWEHGATFYSVGIDNLSVWSDNTCDAPVIDTVFADETSITVNFTGVGASEVAIVEGTTWYEPISVLSTNDNTYTFNGLTPGTDYIVGVRAACGSEWATAPIATAVHPCVMPTALAASNITLTGATLSWTAGEEGQTNFELRITGPNYDDTIDVTTTSYEVTGLYSNTTYNFSVRAVCGANNASEWAAAPTPFTTLTCGTPDQPTVSNIASTSATISWTAPANASGNYEVEYGESGFTQGNGTIVSATGTSVGITGLIPSRGYDVYVRSLCATGVNSTWSTAATFTTSAAPQNHYTVTANVNDATMGYVQGAGQYDEGATATLTAVANAGYRFVQWNTGATTPTISFTVTADVTYTATFEEDIDYYNVTVNVNDTTMGHVLGVPTAPVAEGTQVTLTAEAYAGYHFVNWSDGDTLATRTITVNADVTLTANFARTIVYYTVTLDVNDTTMGYVTGAGQYEAGTTATISAIANQGYHFEHWSDGDTNATRIITVNGNVSYTAVFAQTIEYYTVTVNVNDTTMGYVQGVPAAVAEGTQVTLTAVANAGYHFVNWSDGETAATRTVIVNGPVTLTANFAVTVATYTVTLNVNDTLMGTVTGAGQYDEGTAVTISAIANPGYHFVQWNDGDTNATRIVTVNSNLSFTATFAQNTVYYAVTVLSNDTTMGTVTGSGLYAENTAVTIIATPNTGYHFVSWSNGATTAAATIVVTSDTTVTATFALDETTVNYYTLTVTANDDAMGSVSGAGRYAENTTVELTATANPGYHFVSWNDGDTNATRTVTVTADASYMATFAQDIVYYTVTLDVNDATMGTVTGAGQYMAGDSVTIQAIANAGYHFVNWNDGNTDSVRSFIASANVSFTATFAQTIVYYTVTANVNDATMGYVIGAGQYADGETATLTAIANPGYHFVSWNNGDTASTITFTVTDDMTYTATFAQDVVYYTLTLNVNDATMGIVTGAGQYEAGETVTFSAVANTGYHFVSWNDGDTNATRTITLNANLSFTATFAVDVVYYTVTATVNNAEMGYITGVPTAPVAEGTQVTLTAVANNGYRFVSWSNGETTPAITITVTEDVNLTATFESEAVQTYTLTVNVNNAAMGRVNGIPEGPVAAGTQVTLTAVANTGYQFDNWSTGETTATIIVTVNSDMTITANFSTVGIDDVATTAINMYPNPATNFVTLTGIEGTATVTVVDMNGRENGKWTVTNGELTIDVTDFAQGAYFVRIVGEQVNAIRKLIVR